MGRARAGSSVHRPKPRAYQDRELCSGRRADLHPVRGAVAKLPQAPRADPPDVTAVDRKVRVRDEVMGDSADLLANADRAAASGDLAQAQKLLKQAVAGAPDDVQLLLKLAAV